MNRQTKFTAVAALLLLVMVTSCAMRGAPYVVHPGAVNELDSRTYDGLLFVKGMLNNADKLPPVQSVVVAMVARLRSAHAIAYSDWMLYRTAFKAGTPSAGLAATMQKDTATMNTLAAAPALAVLIPVEAK